MVNILIVDDNIYYAKMLMDSINYRNIRVCNLAINGNEALNILKNTKDIDIILLDLVLPDYNGTEILTTLSNENYNTYEKSFIVISGYTDMIEKIKSNKLVYNIIKKPVEFSIIKKTVIDLVKYKIKEKENKEYKNQILNEINYLGYNLSYKGTIYLIESISFLLFNQKRNYNNLKKEIYPIIAKRHHETIYNIKNNITKATERMYYECDSQKLIKYFNFDYEYKPTVKMVIYTIINKILEEKNKKE